MILVPVVVPCTQIPVVGVPIAPAQTQQPTAPPESTPMPAEGEPNRDGKNPTLGLGLGLGLEIPLFLLIAFLVWRLI